MAVLQNAYFIHVRIYALYAAVAGAATALAKLYFINGAGHVGNRYDLPAKTDSHA